MDYGEPRSPQNKKEEARTGNDRPKEQPLNNRLKTRMIIDKIRKRDGRVVDFDRAKIENAIEKALQAVRGEGDRTAAVSVTDMVISDLSSKESDATPLVEEVQDLVEKNLVASGYFDIAKAYIIYREKHAELREEKHKQLLTKIEKGEIKVKKRDGSLVNFDADEIRSVLKPLFADYKNEVNIDEIIKECENGIYEGITTSEINTTVIFSLRSRIERDPVYSHLTAKLLINELYKEILGTYEFEGGFAEKYRGGLEKAIKNGVTAGRIDKKLLGYDFKKLSAVIDPARDGLFRYLGAQTLYDRYFLKDYDQNILETPQYFWMRVAMGLALNEKDKNAAAIEFYNALSQLRYVTSTPTLFHSGTVRPQMSSCYITTVEDDLKHIFKCVADDAELAKWSGGIGNDWTNIRGTGALIKSTNVQSQGVIPFLKIVDATTAAINRSGKRRGAACVYLEAWHYDIESFIELRKNTGDDRRRTHDTNIAVWIPDLFIKRIIDDKEWTLFSPNETPDLHHIYGRKFEKQYEKYEAMADNGEMELWKRMPAKDLWRHMITMLFETGHPWITFKDPCNIRSPQDHVGVVHSSNLCTEITLNTSKDETAVCNLGSINIAAHITGGRLDKARLEGTVKTAMRMLDNVVDINFYPTTEAETSNLRHRPVGLGIMGLQDALYKLDLAFASDEAIDFSDELMEFISYHAILSSSELAKEKGTYKSYEGSKWDRGLLPLDTLKLLEEERGVPTGVGYTSRMNWEPVRAHVKQHGMRNSNCMAIAPTATISNISGVYPSIEPIYKNVYVKSNFSGEFTVINEDLIEDLKKLNLWNMEMLEKIKYFDGNVSSIPEIPMRLKLKYQEVFEIDPHWLIKHAAYRGKWIDQSQSLNILTSSHSGSFISDVYVSAWKMGLKTTYYLRTLGASAIEKSTLDINKKFDSAPKPEPVAVSAEKPAGGDDVLIVGETCESCQ
ncbi:MAG: ribonucleoside-diphosphate reductase subunit alpha [Patescibacteria group bacterium]|nr:ribonucleoside-diphosphate reductase subunit alpha [Patescibacteria group bacterium]